MHNLFFYAIIYSREEEGMQPTQYALPPESIVDIAFKYNGTDYNIHVNTYSGIITVQNITKETTEDIFTKILS